MSLDAPATMHSAPSWAARRPSLPAVGAFLSAVWDLGLKSFRAALPALAFEYFFYLGAKLYLEFTMEPGGIRDPQFLTEMVMLTVASIPLLFVVYAPVLLVEDAVHRGSELSYWSATIQVLRRVVPLAALIVFQGLILFGPPLLLLGGVGLMVRSFPSIPGAELGRYVQAATFIALVPCAVYFLVIGFLQFFAQPALIMDSKGPIAAIRSSFSLVASHFGGLLGRLFVFLVVYVVASVALSLPIAFLGVMTALSGAAHPVVKVASVIWESAVSAAMVPFQLAAVLILYRSVRPAGAGVGPDGIPVPADAGEAPRRATSPFQFE